MRQAARIREAVAGLKFNPATGFYVQAGKHEAGWKPRFDSRPQAGETSARTGRRPKSAWDRLTPREREILSLLAKGFLYKEIAAQLGISPNTVRAHLHTVYGKLAVKSRTQAAVYFLQR